MAFRNIQVDLDDAVFQAALNRATSEGKAIGQVIAEFLRQYVDGMTTGSPTTYTIQRGDTLGKIAKRLYGDARKYPIIQRANNITDPGRIWVGQVLVIPPVGNQLAMAPAATMVSTSAISSRPSPPVVPTTSPIAMATTSASPAPAGVGEKPAVEWVGSPNFNQRLRADDITAIIIHSTASSTLQGVISWFNNPNAKVSAHYTISKDGRIVQHVRDEDRAWHAGQSVWKGRHSCNDYTIGIELVNLNDGRDPYPEAQHQANAGLCAYLRRQYNIRADDIAGHVDIALPPGRKSDPRGYDLDRLRRDVAAIVGG
jgi:LysM repeat protein